MPLGFEFEFVNSSSQCFRGSFASELSDSDRGVFYVVSHVIFRLNSQCSHLALQFVLQVKREVFLLGFAFDVPNETRTIVY